jgi:hypothetical protein
VIVMLAVVRATSLNSSRGRIAQANACAPSLRVVSKLVNDGS